jgi:hypothetical protein
MRNKDATRLPAECVPQAEDEVPEMDIGSGLNLPFYCSLVKHIYGVEPALELEQNVG